MALSCWTRTMVRRWRWLRFIIFVLTILETNGESAEQMFELHPEYIDLFLHRATTVALFEAKARKELRKLSNSEEVIFKECATSARTVLAMAKCVSRVLDTRDKMNADIVEELPADNNCDFDHSDGNWVMGLMRTIYRTFACPKEKKEEEERRKKKKEFTMKIDIKKSNYSTSAAESLLPKPVQHIIQKLHPARLRFNRTSRLDALRRKAFQFGKNQRTLKFRSPDSIVQGKERSVWENRRPKLDIKRLKRDTTQRLVYNVSKRCETPKNVALLRSVQAYFDKMNHVIRFTYKMGKSNEKFFKEMNENVAFQNRPPNGQSPYEEMQKMMQQLEEFDDKGVISILSPKLFNLMPDQQDPESKRYMSPNMLSFQDEGMLPLPRLFKLSNTDECETLKWLDLLLDFTGGTKMLKGHVDRLGEHMKTVDETLYPRLLETEKMEKHYDKVHGVSTEEQKRQMKKFGYAPLSAKQLEMMYGDKGVLPAYNVDIKSHMDDPDAALEKTIRRLSSLTPEEVAEVEKYQKDESTIKQGGMNEQTEMPFRTKRQAPTPPRRPTFFDFRDLDPFAFTQRIANPNILGHYVISPYAFYLQVFSPTLLNMEIINPRAFIATIFSPVVLVLRVLSPSAFRLMLFSPLMLIAWIMVPEAFLAKIFSPKLLDARILSPESFSAIVLSPGAGVMRIASPNAMNVLVLSPSIFTYGLWSGNRYVVQVLSPGLVGVDQHPILKPE